MAQSEEPTFPISTPAAILIGAVLISFAILVSNGVIKLGGTAVGMGTQAAPTTQQAGATPAPSVYKNVTAGDFPIQGNKDAKVLVVEWADYQCPFCEQFFTQVEPQIKKDYIDTGKIKFAFRDFPFLGQPNSDSAGDESMNAANAARCANEQGKFWDYHDYLYSHQGQEDQGAFSKDNLKKFAADLGLNTSQFDGCVDSNKYVQAATDDMNAGKAVGVTGTPTVYINGTQIVGAEPYASFKDAIDKALASAK